MGIFHKFISGGVDLDNPDIVRMIHDWNDDHNSPAQVCVAFHDSDIETGVVWTNQPAAMTEFFGDQRTRRAVDLRFATQVRFIAEILAGGASGAQLRAVYSTDGGVNFYDLGPSISMALPGHFATNWFTIPVAARIESAIVCFIGVNGNGVADPRFRSLDMQIR
jgi:hypothetical protein